VFNRFHQMSKGYRVRSLSLHFYSSKKASGVVELVSDDPGDAILVGDVAEWLRRSAVGSDDYLTDRYFLGRRKSVTAKAVRSAVKSFCASRGLDPARFSTKSMRSGFATHYSTCGGNAEERNARGLWAKGSTVPERHYTYGGARGAFSLGTSSGKGLSLRDMARMSGAGTSRRGTGGGGEAGVLGVYSQATGVPGRRGAPVWGGNPRVPGVREGELFATYVRVSFSGHGGQHRLLTGFGIRA
jgi:hypothetical protein